MCVPGQNAILNALDLSASFPLPECAKAAAGQVLLQVNAKSRVSPRWCKVRVAGVPGPKDHSKAREYLSAAEKLKYHSCEWLGFPANSSLCLKLQENEREDVNSRASNTQTPLSSESLLQQVGSFHPAFSQLHESGAESAASP